MFFVSLQASIDACNKGCDNFKAADHYDNIIGDHDQNDSLSLCQHSCEDTFVGAEDKQSKLAWCNQGTLFWQEKLKFTIQKSCETDMNYFLLATIIRDFYTISDIILT